MIILKINTAEDDDDDDFENLQLRDVENPVSADAYLDTYSEDNLDGDMPR